MNQDIPAPSMLNRLLRIPSSLLVIFDSFKKPNVMTPRQFCNNLLQKFGKAAGEWSREVLLRAARNPGTDPLFVEIVGLRMLPVRLLEPLLVNAELPPDTVNNILKQVRESKHAISGGQSPRAKPRTTAWHELLKTWSCRQVRLHV